MIEVIDAKEAWDSLIDAFENVDFYHSYDYHQISKNEGDKPILIKYLEKTTLIVLPLIVRNIPNTNLFDATSVYGYPGPLFKSNKTSFDTTNFKNALINFFLENDIVSVFSRLNPFIPMQEYVLQGMGEIVTPGNIVNIDISQKPEFQLKAYNKRLRTYINKCRRTYLIKEGKSPSDVKRFTELYYGNMERVEAKPKYFFEEEYFTNLLSSDGYKTTLLMAIAHESKQIVGGALFVQKHKIVQYHLSGVAEAYLKLNPIKMLIDEMRIRATFEGYQYFNLGGGVANKEDTLFQFKKSFSHDIRPFNVWRYIVNKKAYDDLVRSNNTKSSPQILKPCNDFFPCYRIGTSEIDK